MAQHNAPQQLNDLLIAKNFDVNALDSQGQPATDPSQAKVFNFNWVAESGKDYGTVVATIGENNDLTVYTGDNVGKQMEGNDKNEWFKFLEQMRMFSKRNLMTFSVQNLNKLKYSQQGQAAMKEGLHESWMGRKDRSWNGGPTEARLMIKHKRVIGENEARYRYVESLFIETADGERFKLPFTKLSAGKAMLEHVRQGGRPYDPRGNHIATIVTEMNLLARFRRANQGKIFEGEAATLVEQAEHHYATLQHNIKSLGTKAGYKKYFESWDPTSLNDEDVIIEDLRCMFVEQNIDSRIEQALPLLSRLQKQEDAMKEIGIFEGWVNCLSEGTWALPDTPEKQQKLIQLLADELPVGPDATNATELLYDLIGDDDLFDQLHDLAKEDANADARTVVINKLEQMSSNPAIAQVIGKLKVEKQAPPPEAPPAEPVAEDLVCETCHQSVCECGMHESAEEQIQKLAELSGTGMQRVFKNGEWVKPEPKPVNELSSDTLKSYIKKASSSGEENSASNLASRAANKLASFPDGMLPAGVDDGSDDDHKSYMRSKGIARAVDKLEELSKDTLGSYVKKASSDRAMKNFDQGVDMGTSMNDRVPKFDKEKDRQDDNRRRGIHKAVDRLVKESQLNESGMSEADILFQEIARGSVDIYDIYAHPKTAIEKFVSDQIHDRVEEISRERGIPQDDDIDKILEIIFNDLGDDFGIAETVGGGNWLEGMFSDKDTFQIRTEPNDSQTITLLNGETNNNLQKFARIIDKINVGHAKMMQIKGMPDATGFKFDSPESAAEALSQLNNIKGIEMMSKQSTNEMFGFGMPKFKAQGNLLSITGDQKAGAKVMAALQKANPQLAAQGKHNGGTGPDGPQYYGIEFATPQLAAQAAQSLGQVNETTALTGQYGHSGKLEAVKGLDQDMMDRIKFLAGISK